MSTHENILSALRNAVVSFRADDCRAAAFKALERGMDPRDAILDGLAVGMEKVGVLYDTSVYFVPEVLLSADALYAGLEILHPHMKKTAHLPKATLIIGSIQGDVHDIGKNLVKVMCDAAGWEIHDLGYDVPLDKFVEKQIEIDADIIAMSAMMTTTMMGMKKLISMLRENHLDCLTMVGGAPVNQDIADLFGADGYADSAEKVVPLGIKMIQRSQQMRQKNRHNA